MIITQENCEWVPSLLKWDIVVYLYIINSAAINEICLNTFATPVNNWLSFSPLLKQYNIGQVGLLFKPQQRETS